MKFFVRKIDRRCLRIAVVEAGQKFAPAVRLKQSSVQSPAFPVWWGVHGINTVLNGYAQYTLDGKYGMFRRL
jgi:hypothetical protein